MLILVLIDVQYSQKAIFSFEKGLIGQNHTPLQVPTTRWKNSPPSKISDPSTLLTAIWKTLIKYDIIDYGVTMDLQKKSFIETGESCSHWLKITLWKELGRLVYKYKITI